MLLWTRCWPVRRGAPGAGGAPGPRSGVIPPLPRAGVREHHAPVGALRQFANPNAREYIKVREHHAPVGALRPTNTPTKSRSQSLVREHHAPVGALRPQRRSSTQSKGSFVREHHAPAGALRHQWSFLGRSLRSGQGAPRTCRCIETQVMSRTMGSVTSGSTTHCRCIETGRRPTRRSCRRRQGAPRTCRCIETTSPLLYQFAIASLAGASVCARIGIAVAGR